MSFPSVFAAYANLYSHFSNYPHRVYSFIFFFLYTWRVKIFCQVRHWYQKILNDIKWKFHLQFTWPLRAWERTGLFYILLWRFLFLEIEILIIYLPDHHRAWERNSLKLSPAKDALRTIFIIHFSKYVAKKYTRRV